MGNVNQVGQFSTSSNVSTTNTQSTGQEIIVLNDEAKGNQESSNYQTGSGQKSLTDKEVGKAVDKLNKLLEDKETHAEYEIYGKFKDLTVKIVNNKTKEVVQELPPRKIIDMIDKLCELAGIFVDQKV